MMTINWTDILQNLGIFGLLIAGLSWTFKKLGELYLQKRFAAYEKELQLKSQEYQMRLDMTLESHKAELNLMFIKSSKLHKKRLEILVDLYKKMAALDRDMNIMIAYIKPIIEDAQKEEQQRIETAGKSYNDFQAFYSDNKIFFSEKICSGLDNLRDKYFDGYMDYTFSQRFGVSDFKFSMDIAKKASETVKKSIPGILKEIETEFRRLLLVN